MAVLRGHNANARAREFLSLSHSAGDGRMWTAAPRSRTDRHFERVVVTPPRRNWPVDDGAAAPRHRHSCARTEPLDRVDHPVLVPVVHTVEVARRPTLPIRSDAYRHSA